MIISTFLRKSKSRVLVLSSPKCIQYIDHLECPCTLISTTTLHHWLDALLSTLPSFLLMVQKYYSRSNLKFSRALASWTLQKGLGSGIFILLNCTTPPVEVYFSTSLMVRFSLVLKFATSTLTTPSVALKFVDIYETIWTINCWALFKPRCAPLSEKRAYRAIPTLEATNNCGLVF